MVFVVCPHILKAFIRYVMWSACVVQPERFFKRKAHAVVAKYLSDAHLTSPVGLVNSVNLIHLISFKQDQWCEKIM